MFALVDVFKKEKMKLVISFDFDVLSLIISRFGYYVDRINPIELEIKNIRDTAMSASYLDLHLNSWT